MNYRYLYVCEDYPRCGMLECSKNTCMYRSKYYEGKIVRQTCNERDINTGSKIGFAKYVYREYDDGDW